MKLPIKNEEAAFPEMIFAISCLLGTTGLPKGAMLTHSAVTRGYNDWADIVGLQAGDRYLIVNPFFHSFGLNAGILACLMKGACMLPHPIFDVAEVMHRVLSIESRCFQGRQQSTRRYLITLI